MGHQGGFLFKMAKMDEMNHRKEARDEKRLQLASQTSAILGKKGAQLPTSASMDNDDLDLRRKKPLQSIFTKKHSTIHSIAPCSIAHPWAFIPLLADTQGIYRPAKFKLPICKILACSKNRIYNCINCHYTSVPQLPNILFQTSILCPKIQLFRKNLSN